tara:strand:- start:18160 stop:18354 length:195 start_codon:yes stop_codon:yes gene_type:complete
MKNVISLQESRIKRDIKNAYTKLKEVRTLISYGKHEMVDEAYELENRILDLEEQLLDLVESDSF